jgi:putative endopeptidase
MFGGGEILSFFIAVIDIMDIDTRTLNNEKSNENNKNSFDLYELINGEWEKNFVLPPEESEWGTFRQLSYDVEQRLKKLLSDPDTGILYQLYQSLLTIGTETDKTEAKTLIDILSLLDPSKYSDNREALGYTIGMLEVLLTNPLFSVHAEQDPKDTETMRLTMIYPGLTLPDKVYYEDDSYSDYVEAFKTHIDTVLSIFSNLIDSPPQLQFLSTGAIGKDVVEIETLIANSVRSAEEKRNMDSFYARMPLSSFIENVSMCSVQDSFDCHRAKVFWKSYFQSAFIESIPNIKSYYSKVEEKIPEELVVYDTPYFQKLTKILMTQPIEKICRYLAYHVISALVMTTVRSFDETYTKFVSIKLNGQQGATPRDDRALRMVDNMVGEFLGKEYVKRHFDQRSKEIVLDMTEKIRDQMRRSIQSNDWMSSKTKEAALLKLQSMNVKIGYPDSYEDRQYMEDGITDRMNKYKDGKRSLTSIFIYIRQCHFAHDILTKIDKPKDPNDWAMNPQDVNAYYSPQMNEIVFPAGILNAPIFDPDQDPAKNYGGVGAVIAHEITHGFDDQGRKYDHHGNIDNWWTMDDLASFKSRVRKMVAQYSEYELDVETDNGPTKMNVNGGLTLGENIADLGGVLLSLRALEDEIRDSGREITNNDRKKFFESYALLWRKKMSPAKTVSRLLSDPHSPSRYRVWVIRNIDSFYDTYGVRPGDLMYLDSADRISIY